MDKKKKILLWSEFMSGSAVDYELLTELINQPNNGSANIKLKVASSYVPSFYGNWASGQNYGVGELRAWPANSSLVWRVVNAISTAPANTTPPSISNTDWELDIALDMIQDSGDGVNFFRTTLQGGRDGFVRQNTFQYGTYANARFTRSTRNYESFAQIGTSASSIATSGAVPALKSFTTQTGLSQLYDSVTLNASYSNTFSIPTVHPTLSTHNIGTGLSIAEGDTLTFYGDATHFFVFTVYAYNSSTGIVSGFSTFNLSTGSYATWTVKKEVLLWFKWTGGAVDAYMLLQTYNSGTGAATATNIFNPAGAGALTSWNITYGKRPPSPTAAQSTNYNVGSQPLAVWHFGEFEGTSVTHRHIKSSAGTGWTYIYLSGPDSSSPPVNTTIDTYNASGGTANQTALVWSNLTYGTHRYVAVSTISPSGSSTNTAAWVYASTNTANAMSVLESVDYDLFTSLYDFGITDAQSAGEMAWRIKLNGSAHTTEWFPQHGTLTNREISKSFVVNGNTVDVASVSSVVNPYLYKYQDFTTVVATQNGAIIHPQDAGDFATYTCVHTLNRNGLEWDFQCEWLKATYIESGYNNQVSSGEVGFNKIKSVADTYMTRPANNTVVNMAADFKNLTSYLFYNTTLSSPGKDLVVGMFWPDVSNWRAGEPQSGTSFWQDFSGTAGAKFYPFSYQGYITTIGETFRIRCKEYFGKWIDANTNL